MKRVGRDPVPYLSLSGAMKHRYIARQDAVEPSLVFVETYRLATYLGSYGAGRIVQTMSLLPGERTTINVRTFRKTEQERKEASSILDSFTDESATDFETALEHEATSQEEFQKSIKFEAGASASAGWSWAGLNVEANTSVKTGTNAAREEFSKNVSSATNKHAQKASAKREVQIDTSYEARESEEEETSVEREIENINLSRTLNYAFRQMNQEFVTICSLVDVRLGFFNGFSASGREVTLPELDSLLQTYIVDDERAHIAADIWASLQTIVDYRGYLHHDFIEERSLGDGDAYWRVRTEKTSRYQDPATGTEIEVPGIIVSAIPNVMRTDGVIVEAVLGAGDALDDYAQRLQEVDVKRAQAETRIKQAESLRLDLINEALHSNDAERIELLEKLSSHDSTSAPVELAVRQSVHPSKFVDEDTQE